MDITYVLTLEEMAIIKIAVALYNDPVLRPFIDKLRVNDRVASFSCEYNFREWNVIFEKAMTRISTFVPALLQKKVVNLLKTIHNEIERWWADHHVFFILLSNIDIHGNLCWKSEGTIDRIKTVKKLVQMEELGVSTRLLLACTYFLEKEISILWNKMSPLDKLVIHRITGNISVEFWGKCLKRRNTPWTNLAKKYLQPPEGWVLEPSRIRLSSFYHALSSGAKRDFTACFVRPERIHNDDLRFCLFQMNEIEKKEMLETYPHIILDTLLQWPLQSLFMKIADLVWDHLPECEYLNLLHIILYRKILKEMNDFDYIQLLAEFWKHSPSHFKDHVKNDPVYEPLMRMINYDRSQPFPLKSLYQNYLDFILTSRRAYSGYPLR
ncbi:uncharacterized protein CEXT_556901 [Caerostris extrusa]|uniref:Uncharacterized protein n=1 Tax=Caerostris extrusa TaxID=172846 RepID=A0AAV4XN35_CAEEX|nr:uncharacterized protein CEXT_556901 [Caerostris extrusa]